MEAYGGHGLHIRFSDGHERGVYPWGYLKVLGDDPDHANRLRSGIATDGAGPGSERPNLF